MLKYSILEWPAVKLRRRWNTAKTDCALQQKNALMYRPTQFTDSWLRL